MRDRLIELLDDTLQDWECDVSNKTLTEIAEHLWDNGVIVTPCVVGDRLYDIYEAKVNGYGDIREMKVTEIKIILDKRNKPWLIISGYYFAFEDFGKTVFLTKEEAEAKLKELKERGTEDGTGG